MTLFICWVVFPIVLAALSAGCGLLLERAGGFKLPGVLLVPVGMTVIVAVGMFATMTGATAVLATPIVVGLAVAGVALAWPLSDRRPDRWVLVAALVVFAAFAAPVVLSGEATFTGFIKLDDTSSWLGITDRVMNHGYDYSGLQPSTYQAMLDFYLGSDYPVGSFMPLGIGGKLVGQDYIWLYQPYLAFLAAMLACGLYALATPLVKSPPMRAFVVAIASQPAVLFGYTMLGGAKELVAAALIPVTVALIPVTLKAKSVRAVVPLAFSGAAIIAALSFGGIIWLVPAALALLVIIVRFPKLGFGWRSAGALVGLVALLLIPAARGLDFLARPAASTVTDEERLANLFAPLDPLQTAGIWPVGDFRLTPASEGLTYVLIAVALGAAAAGVYFAWRRRSWTPLLYIAGVVAGAFVIAVAGSPWVEAKGYAIASPAIVLFALAGAAAIFSRGRRVEAAVLAGVITAGILWSNALAYHDVNLAPRPQLAELEEINDEIDGEGPTLLTDYQSFGARYLLRDGDPEAVSELRRRKIPTVDGGEVPKGRSADTDELDLKGLLTYRTLVLRRSPIASRPPAPYSLVRKDRYYEVWQRPETVGADVREHLPLGGKLRPAAVPSCAEVKRLAGVAGDGGRLVAAIADSPVFVGLGESEYPDSWKIGPTSGSLRVNSSGTVETSAVFPDTANYEAWVGGSWGGSLKLTVDGEEVGELRNRVNNSGAFEQFGRVKITAGERSIDLDYDESGLHPGSAARPAVIGPVVFAQPGDQRSMRTVSVEDAESLCGKPWDWIEAIGP